MAQIARRRRGSQGINAIANEMTRADDRKSVSNPLINASATREKLTPPAFAGRLK
jgi:hypothetical protein